MDYTKLGRSGLVVSRFALGTAPIGELYSRIDEPEAHATVDAALEGGVTLFDTSPLYGFGLAELRLGASLRRHSTATRPTISTKVGRRMPGPGEALTEPAMQLAGPGGLRQPLVFDYSADGAKRSLEQSLLRIGVEAIDIVLIHDVDRTNHGAQGVERRYQEAMSGAYPALESLRAQGLVKAIGIGVNEADMAARFIEAGDLDVVLLAGRYSLLEQPALVDLLPLARSRGIAVMLGGVFNSGILATGAVDGAHYNYAPAPPEITDRVRAIERVCRAHGVALRDAALRFPLGHPSVTTVVVGAASRDEVVANLAAFEAMIPSQLWLDLKAEGLLATNAPVPA